MSKTEKLLAVAVSITAGIAIAYIQKCKRLERENKKQADEVKRLHKFIYKEVLI
jgi:uncharacterized protein (UPF0335 family)